ncbi:hypothetical protein V6V47_02960 [Micromonospora sp. CPCC 205539]|uniref:hypothetical protein n=1 Tax=Micromonospora sp. CPCC 205539 TaxID=3122408 RepID=UPI002FF22ED1
MGESPEAAAPAPSTPPRHEHRTALLTALIGAAAAIVGAIIAGVFALLAAPDDDPAPQAQPPGLAASAPTTPAATPQAAPGSVSPTPSATSPSTDTVRWANTVRLTYVDLDEVPVKVLSSNTGASVWVSYGTSEDNLYGLNGGFFTTKPSIAAWEGASPPTRKQCSDLIATQGTETSPIAKGSRFCVLTAADRVAYLAVTKFDKASGTYLATATVWETPDE